MIRQNKKAALLQFLFGSQESIAPTEIQKYLKDKIESLESQVFSLQQRVSHLENQNLEKDMKANMLSEAPKTTVKASSNTDSTVALKKGPSSLGNDSEVRDSTSRGKDME